MGGAHPPWVVVELSAWLAKPRWRGAREGLDAQGRWGWAGAGGARGREGGPRAWWWGVFWVGKRPERAPHLRMDRRAADRSRLPTADRVGAGERRGKGERGAGRGTRAGARLRRQRRGLRATVGLGVLYRRCGLAGSYKVITLCPCGVRERRSAMAQSSARLRGRGVLEAADHRVCIAPHTYTPISTVLLRRGRGGAPGPRKV